MWQRSVPSVCGRTADSRAHGFSAGCVPTAFSWRHGEPAERAVSAGWGRNYGADCRLILLAYSIRGTMVHRDPFLRLFRSSLAMRAQLIPLDGGPPLELTKDLILGGRKEDCDLRLDHKSVSKQHCVLVKSDAVLLVRDLASTNGTRVNGQRVRRAALLQNEQLSIASLKFRVHIGPGKPPVLPDECTQQLSAPEFANMMESQP